jgi:hypothetical protein
MKVVARAGHTSTIVAAVVAAATARIDAREAHRDRVLGERLRRWRCAGGIVNHESSIKGLSFLEVRFCKPHASSSEPVLATGSKVIGPFLINLWPVGDSA